MVNVNNQIYTSMDNYFIILKVAEELNWSLFTFSAPNYSPSDLSLSIELWIILWTLFISFT
jgi:hypothetical protein